MKREPRFTEADKRAILAEGDRGKIMVACRKHGISTPTYYAWKKKFGVAGQHLPTPEKRAPKDIDAVLAENAKLKQLVANQALEILELRG